MFVGICWRHAKDKKEIEPVVGGWWLGLGAVSSS
jgi:hypothetical protein